MRLPERLQKRSSLLQAVRSFFHSRGYVEVDTPTRIPTPLPEAHIKPFSSEGWYLQSSPEQCMKRLLALGSRQLFQICPCFRKEEIGRYHQSEFTMLEWYQVGWSYIELMAECEEFVRDLADSVPHLEGVKEKDILLWQGKEISLKGPWKRMTVAEAFMQFADLMVDEALRNNMYDEILVTQVEPYLGWERPVFLYDYPVQLGSLARRKEANPEVAERFELYIGGVELANGFSELTDPEEQRRRFIAEMNRAEALGNSYPALPEKFLDDLENLGDTAGIALGLDRLFMILLGCATVTEVMCLSANDL